MGQEALEAALRSYRGEPPIPHSHEGRIVCTCFAVTEDQMKSVAREIESQLQNQLQQEVTTYKIGELVMEKLRALDEVAYVRFASVYREFKDINTFMDELKNLITEKKRRKTKK